MRRSEPLLSRFEVWAAAALVALVAQVALRFVVGAGANGDDDMVLQALRAVDDSRRLFVLDQWLLVVAQVATVVAIAVYLASPERRSVETSPAQRVRSSAVAMAAIWAGSGVVAAALRAQLVRWDLSLIDEQGLERFVGELIFSISDYVAGFGLVAFAVSLALLSAAESDDERLDHFWVSITAGIAAAAVTLAAVGSAFPMTRDRRVGDSSALRPGGGVGVFPLLGWAALLVVLVVAGWREAWARRKQPAEG